MSETDRELLEAAARAVGFEGEVTEYPSGHVEMGLTNHWKPDGSNVWAPLHRDDDAFRLAVVLDIDISWLQEAGGINRACKAIRVDAGSPWNPCVHEEIAADKGAAVRRAITRAAAKIGKTTSEGKA